MDNFYSSKAEFRVSYMEKSHNLPSRVTYMKLVFINTGFLASNRTLVQYLVGGSRS